MSNFLSFKPFPVALLTVYFPIHNLATLYKVINDLQNSTNSSRNSFFVNRGQSKTLGNTFQSPKINDSEILPLRCPELVNQKFSDFFIPGQYVCFFLIIGDIVSRLNLFRVTQGAQCQVNTFFTSSQYVIFQF